VTSRGLVALATVAALLGCGESEEDEAPPDDPRRVAIAYLEAINDTDAPAVCDLVALEASETTTEQCEQDFGRLFEQDDFKDSLDPRWDPREAVGEITSETEDTVRIESPGLSERYFS